MKVEPKSFLQATVEEATSGGDQAEQALALAADAIRLQIATMNILSGLLALSRQQNPGFAHRLDGEMAAMHSRIDSIAGTLGEIEAGRKTARRLPDAPTPDTIRDVAFWLSDHDQDSLGGYSSATWAAEALLAVLWQSFRNQGFLDKKPPAS